VAEHLRRVIREHRFERELKALIPAATVAAGVSPANPLIPQARDRAFRSTDPWRKHKIRITSNKKVNVIRHDHVATNGDVMLVDGTRAIGHECSLDSAQLVNRSAISRAESDEEERRVCKNTVERRRPIFDRD
jgi:hypothetical protein